MCVVPNTNTFNLALYLMTNIFQDAVFSVDCWTKEKPISSSSDRSVRIWKVAEETHLVFRGHKSSIDNVQWLTDSTFVSAGQDGHLHYWKDSQKSSFSHVSAAHGFDESNNPRWISGLANIKMSNIVATGSNDGKTYLYFNTLPLCVV